MHILLGGAVILAVLLLVINHFMTGQHKGSINIRPDQPRYCQGDTVQAQVTCEFKRPFHCEAVTVSLLFTSTRQSVKDGKTHRRTSTTKVDSQKIDVAAPVEPGQPLVLDVRLKIPPAPSEGAMLVDWLIELVRDGRDVDPEWSIEAEVALPGLNISQREQIAVRRAP
jgi:hypothetical protein